MMTQRKSGAATQARNSRGSVKQPRMAAAAAVAGLASNVRAPGPWRPSKFRLLVLTAYCPDSTRSPFIPRHIEHPGSRQFGACFDEDLCEPLGFASRLTCSEPGTTSIRTPGATLWREALAPRARDPRCVRSCSCREKPPGSVCRADGRPAAKPCNAALYRRRRHWR